MDKKAKEAEAPKPAEKEVKVEETKESKPLTQDLLDSCLPEIRNHFRQAERKFEQTILDQEIKLISGEVRLEVSGHMQEEIANKMKPDLVGLIRKLTGANGFTIGVHIKEEEDDNSGKLYTDSDKLIHLMKKYPALGELQRKFGLDVNF